MKLHTFEIVYLYGGIEYSKIYTKFCRYPKKTKLYRNIITALNNKSKNYNILKIKIY